MSAAMEVIESSLNAFINNPTLHPLLTILKSARNGAVYGAKIRFPHALVMVFMFRSGTFREKIALVLNATRQHAMNLARFATIYKTAMLVLRLLHGKEGSYDTLLAGGLGGYYVFGKSKRPDGAVSSVKQQIVIYVFARVCLAIAKICVQEAQSVRNTPMPEVFTQRLSPETRELMSRNAWPVFASLSWAMVMYVFRWQPESVQSSLRSSMKYIYVNCEEWDGVRNFVMSNTAG